MIEPFKVVAEAKLKTGGLLFIEKNAWDVRKVIAEILDEVDNHLGAELIKLEIQNDRFNQHR